MLDNILKSASALGACERLDKVKNFHSLTSLFFTPQGLEFCHLNSNRQCNSVEFIVS